MPELKRIVLTGASRGLGRALTEGFIKRGHIVLGCARGSAAIEELRREFPSPNRFDVVDVSDESQVADWAEAILGDGGPPDLLINNAATINASAKLWEVPSAQFSKLIDVNIKGVFHVIRHVVPAMVAHGEGVIVNFSSTWGRVTSAEVAPYCASKFAIEGLTQALAQELPGGMAAVPLNPGVIDTDMLRSCFGEAAGEYPKPENWAKRAVTQILSFGPRDNGHSLTIG